MKAVLGQIIKAVKFLIPYSFSVVFDCSTLISFVSQVFANVVVHLKTQMDIPPDATQSDILWNQVAKNSFSKKKQSALVSFTAGFWCRLILKTGQFIQ